MIDVQKKGPYCIIVLDREKSLNALSSDMLDELIKALESLADERAVIFTGKGKAFAAGADIKEMLSMDGKAAEAFAKKGQALYNKIEDMNRLTVAAINGFCIGGGLELASACDIRIAKPDVLFGLPELKLGVVPGWGAFYRVRRIIGDANLKEFLYTAELFSSEKAKKIGLIQRIEKNPLKAAEKVAHNFSLLSFHAFLKAKEMLSETGRDDVLKQESFAVRECFMHADKKEGMSAFLEKRDPEFN